MEEKHSDPTKDEIPNTRVGRRAALRKGKTNLDPDGTNGYLVASTDDIKAELVRETVRHEYRRWILDLVGVLVVIAAIATLMVTRIFVLIQVTGNSMEPTLREGEIIAIRQTKDVSAGEIIGFYYGGKILLKRVIADPGDEIVIDSDGAVFVNGREINEPYVKDKSLEENDLEYPFTVPPGEVFVLGDNRSKSLDSRLEEIGCVTEEQIVGKAAFIVWPLNRIRRVQ